MRIFRRSLAVLRFVGVVISKPVFIWSQARSPRLKNFGSTLWNIAGLAFVLFLSLTILAMMCAFLKPWFIFLDLALALSGATLTVMCRR